jgi:hypothetical protein
MTVGCLLTLPAMAGLYAMALELPGLGLGVHIAVAACAAECNAFTGFATTGVPAPGRRHRCSSIR